MAHEYRFIGSPAKAGGSPYKVMLATPVSQNPACAYTVALAATIHSLASFGVEAHVYLHQGNCHVDDARNTMIRDFLESDCTDLFFLDADLGWRPQSVMRFLEVPGDIVAGVYCHRSPGETYPFHPGEGVRESNEHGLFRMHKVPTGFMRIRRNVLETLYEAEKAKGRSFWWGQEEREGRRPITRIVERGFLSELGLEGLGGSNSDYHSGDYMLCLKARAAGFEVWVDIEHWFEHVGEQCFQGHLGNKLRRDQGVDHPGFAAAMADVKAGKADSATFRAINMLSGNPRYALPGKLLETCYNAAKGARGHILECGSGLSTVVMGLALAGADHVLYALEHDLDWFRTTSRWLDRYGVGNVMLFYAPIHPHEAGDWYGVSPDELPDAFDVVLIDGPAREVAPREGVFQQFGGRVAEASVWLVDDCGDPVQAAMVAEHGANRDVEHIIDVGGGSPHKMAIARRRQEPVSIAAE